MWWILNLVKRKLVWFVAVFMLLGLANGYFFETSYLKPLIIPLTILMVYPMMVSMDIKKVFVKCCYKLQLATQAINFIFIPLFAFFLGKIFFPDSSYLAFGLLLLALLPTSGMTISWTGFAKGNKDVAVKMTIIGLIAGIIIAPFYGYLLMGKVISIPLSKTIQQIALVIVIPLVFGLITQFALRKWLGEAKFNKDVKPKFPEISLLGVIGIIFVAMSLKASQIIQDPLFIVKVAVPLVVLYAVNYTVTSLIGKKFFSRENSIAMVYGSVMRNLSIALAIAITVFQEQGTEMAVLLSVAYIIQIKSAALYIKFADKIFGKPKDYSAKDVMQEGVFALHTDSTLQEAIRLLDEEHIHSVAVLDEKEKVVGILTAEMVINVLAEGYKREQQLEKIKLLPAVKFKETAPLNKVMKAMKRKHSYKVLLTDEKGKISGVLTEADILNRFSSD